MKQKRMINRRRFLRRWALEGNQEKNTSNQQKDCTTSSTTEATTNGTERKSTKYSSNYGDYKNIRATVVGSGETPPIVDQPIRREENPFSFKHFLNRDTSSSNSPSSSSITLTSVAISSSSLNSNVPTTTASVASSSTGPLSNDLIDSHVVNSSNNNCTSSSLNLADLPSPSVIETASSSSSIQATTIASTSSLSSIASTYQTSTGARPKVPQSSSVSTTSMSSLAGGCPAESSASSRMKRSPRFSSFDSQASLAEYTATLTGALSSTGGSSGRDMSSSFRIDPHSLADDHIVSSSDRSDSFVGNNYDKNGGGVHRSFSNYDMDLPGRSPQHCGRVSPIRKASPSRPNRLGGIFPQGSISNKNQSNRPSNSEFAASALPDFVQDHWMDPWYFKEMNLSSPANSPNSPNSPVNFVEDLPAGMANPIGQEMCQTLPDFLSDGPIIHSSGRLADVAAGLPNLDSPEDDSPSLQISRLQLENDRLRRELDETRLTLAEQTRRAGELERVLEQTRSNESAYNRTLAQNIGLAEENLDQSKKRTAAAQNQVSKLKQQVKQLTAEVETLRRENDALREDGAVGGSERATRRPSRTQQLSRDLLYAASTAESNLRQLLTGVENLRLMAATIENMDHVGYESPTNPTAHQMHDDFPSDDYDEFTGGPAL